MTTPSDNRPLVLHCVASGGLYGIERFLLNLLPSLADQGCRVELACMSVAPGGPHRATTQALADRYAASGGTVHIVEIGRGLSMAGLARLGTLLWRTRPALIHTHGYKATVMAGLLARIGRLPIVATCHAEARQAVGLERQAAMEGRALKHVWGAAAVSQGIGNELVDRGIAPERVHVITTGVAEPAGRWRGPHQGRDGAPTLFAAGRLVPEKNLDVLLDAMARLRDRFPDLRLVIAGDGPLRGELDAHARRLDLGGRVEFPGFLDDIGAPMMASDCYVLPSRTEGMPIALLEALSLGCPTVASAVGSIPSIAEGGRNLVLIAPNDAASLADGIAKVIGDQDYARRLSALAREKYERDHTLPVMARAYLRFYEQVLRKPVTPGPAVRHTPAVPST